MTKRVHRNDRIDSILLAIERNPEQVKTYVVPILVFGLDLVLRVFFQMNVSDAGADMALLGTASFISVLMEDPRGRRTSPHVVLPLFLLFLQPWMLCLWLVAGKTPGHFSVVGWQVNASLVVTILSWLVGMSTFLLSSVFVDHILRRPCVTQG